MPAGPWGAARWADGSLEVLAPAAPPAAAASRDGFLGGSGGAVSARSPLGLCALEVGLERGSGFRGRFFQQELGRGDERGLGGSMPIEFNRKVNHSILFSHEAHILHTTQPL